MKKGLVPTLSLALILFYVTGITAQNSKIDFVFDQKIPMRDGIELSANVWKPADTLAPLPAVLTLTPYISDEGHERGPFFADHGYAYVHADCRGRGNSGGTFYPLEQDGPDCAEVIDWISKQPWCDGRVVMRGGSYRGMVQWQALQHNPKALKTIVPTAAACPGIDFPKQDNIFSSYTARWLGYVSGVTKNSDLFSASPFWSETYYRMYEEHAPFIELARMAGIPENIFVRWVSHPAYDEFWQGMSPSPEDYRNFDVPILTITGYFDGDQPGAMHFYQQHMKYGNEAAKKSHYLVIGPYSHGGTRHPAADLNGLTFGDNSVLNMDQLHIEWYDWILKGKEKPDFLKKRIQYYVMNRNTWVHVDDLDELSDATMTWYLSSEKGTANDPFHSGSLRLDPPAGDQLPDRFVYDPLHLIDRPTYVSLKNSRYTDQTEAFSGPLLIYHSPPIEEPVEIAGYIKFMAYIELDVNDTDLSVSLYEIKPDGSSVYLGQDKMRARYRQSRTRETLVRPGEINLYEFNEFYLFVRMLDRGSRLRLIVRCVNSPDHEKNYNSGGIVAEETGKDARKATIKLYHDDAYPSRLELPINTNPKATE